MTIRPQRHRDPSNVALHARNVNFGRPDCSLKISVGS